MLLAATLDELLLGPVGLVGPCDMSRGSMRGRGRGRGLDPLLPPHHLPLLRRHLKDFEIYLSIRNKQEYVL